jgi:hypothetical protein
MRRDKVGSGRIGSNVGKLRLPAPDVLLPVLQTVAILMAFAIPLAVWPGLKTPFSTPKLVLLAVWVIAGGLGLAMARVHPLAGLNPLLQGLVLGWIGLVSLSALLAEHVSITALLLALLPAGAFLLQAALRPKPSLLLTAAAAAAAVVALTALLQWAGADPFRLFGWAGPAGGSARMRVFATLGNPNFAAAFLTAAAPAAWAAGMLAPPGWRRRAVFAGGGLLLAGGILATGSRAPAAAALAVAAWALLRSARRRYLAALPVAFGILLVTLSPARPLADTVQGRLFIWRVALPHVLATPLLGAGPGSFLLNYPDWETARLAAPDARPAEERFAGFQQHSHNDYLETLADFGIPGLLLLIAIPAVVLVRHAARKRPRPDPAAEGAAAGAVALLALALVDFPLHRPAELFLLWSYLALIHVSNSTLPAAPPAPLTRPGASAAGI